MEKLETGKGAVKKAPRIEFFKIANQQKKTENFV